MPWTLRDLMSEATTMAGAPAYAIQPSRVSFYVNAAQAALASRLPHPELEAFAVSSFTSGEDRYYLPGDCEEIFALSMDTGDGAVGGRVIRQAGPWELDAKSQGTVGGTPEMYLSYATYLQLYPSPNSNFSVILRYKRRTSDITALTSVPSLDTRYHEAILHKTVQYLRLRSGDSVGALQAESLAERTLGRLPTLLALRQRDRAGLNLRLQTKED